MSIKILNEGFELLHKNSLCEEKSNSSDLEKALENALNRLAMRQEMNIKKYEIAFQDAIESQHPDKSWWEVTDCDIFWDLAENRDPSLTIKHIIDNLKPEFKESLGEELEEKEFKVRFYKLEPDSKAGDLDHEEFFDSKEDAVSAYKKAFKKELFSLNPTVWRKQNGEWKRVMNSEMTEAKSRKRCIKESLRRKPMRESEKEPEIKRYSDVRPRSERKYWYFTTHGVQPGSIPRDLNVLEVRDGQNDRGTWGTYVMLDGVLNTSELKYYDMRELVPKEEETERKRIRPLGKRITAWESYKKKNPIRKSCNERNLTRSERHNRNMEKIFSTKKAYDKKFADFLRKNGYSEEQVDELQKQDKLSAEIAKKFTPKGKQPSEILGKILGESSKRKSMRESEMERFYVSTYDEDRNLTDIETNDVDEVLEFVFERFDESSYFEVEDRVAGKSFTVDVEKYKDPYKAYEKLKKLLGESLRRKSKKSIRESFTKKHAKKLKENHRRKLTESFDDMEVFMNTWANYNEYGADSVLTPTGWMSIDDAIEYCEEYADYEPFINDTDNVPFDDINEYSNASSALQELKELQESGVDEDVLEAIIEATGYSVKEAIEIAESGDYYFYPGLSSYTDLAYAVIDEIGGLGEALGDRVVNYIDEDQMRREYSWDIREIMRDSAEQEVDEAHEGEDEDSYDREQEIEDWMDEHEDEYLDMIIDEDIRMAEAGEVDLSNYFDYEAFGRDLSFDGYTITDKGIILVM